MKKLFCLFILSVSFLFNYSNFSNAATTLPWSTTYNCADWTQSDGITESNVNCDGLTGHLDLAICNNGDSTNEQEQITPNANYPGGNGGKGQRHWKGNGINNNSGGTRISWSPAQSEIWVRWYMRYESDFQWSNIISSKWFIFDCCVSQMAIPGWLGLDKVTI